MPYIYNDEDNYPMVEDIHNPTVYPDRYTARMYDRHGEPEPKGKPADGCWNCFNFDWRREACTAGWNNLDESYYNPDTDDRNLTDWCELHDLDPDADPECLNEWGNEP